MIRNPKVEVRNLNSELRTPDGGRAGKQTAEAPSGSTLPLLLAGQGGGEGASGVEGASRLEGTGSHLAFIRTA